MFQFTTVKRTKTRPAPSLAQTDAASSRGATHKLHLAWGEHCVECAAPACYKTCDLFLPTPEGKCRRFEHGIVALPSEGSAGEPAAEIMFRRWGKLEAQGNAAALPVAHVRQLEHALHVLSPAARRLGKVIGAITGQDRWLTVMEALHKRINAYLEARPSTSVVADTLLAEIVNPGDAPISLVFSAGIDKLRLGRAVSAEQLPKPVNVTLDAPPGESRHAIYLDGFEAILLSGLPFTVALTPADGDDAHLIFNQLDVVVGERRRGAISSAAQISHAKAAKLVVFDLDNTLWDGILLEGEVALRPGVRRLFEVLDERGVLLSVASKNAHSDALKKLEEFGLSEFLLFPRIGWGPKSESVAQIVKAIDIGADTVIFVDDNPFERAEVEGAIAGVQVLPDSALATLADHARLQGAVTPESRSRRKMYQEAIVREEAAAAFGDDYIKFLRECEIEVQIRPFDPENYERVVELVQRTNQLNFSGRKYTREEINSVLNSSLLEKHVIMCRDKFGSYGTVGFCLSERLTKGPGVVVAVRDFMLSCRVQGKFIEQAMFWRLAEPAGAETASRIEVDFIRTDRNRAAEMVLEKIGFAMREDGPASLEIAPGDLAVDFLSVV